MPVNVNEIIRKLSPAERKKVEFRYYDVIYHLTDGVKGAMAGELGPEIIETVVGRARVQEVFPAGKKDKAAGLLVLEGVIRKGLNARLLVPLTRDVFILARIGRLDRLDELLAEEPALAHARNPNGDTALHHAVTGRGDVEIIRYLIEHGALPDAKNARGQTALDAARTSRRDRADAVKFLSILGAR